MSVISSFDATSEYSLKIVDVAGSFGAPTARESVTMQITDMRERFGKGGTGYGDFKKQLFEKLWEYFAPMRKRREEILKTESYIDDVLARGAARANEIANQVMDRVRKAVGLR